MSKKRMRAVTQPDSADFIRTSAYLKWEQAGKPAGDGLEFWLEAEREYVSHNGQVKVVCDAVEEEAALAVSSA